MGIKASHSIIFEKLNDMFDVTYKLSTDDKIELQYFDVIEQSSYLDHSKLARPEDAPKYDDIVGRTNDDFYYDHIMMFAPSVSSFRSLGISSDKLLQFFDSGRNIFIGLDESSKSFGRELFKEFGAELFPAKVAVFGGDKGSTKISDKLDAEGVSFTSNMFQSVKKTIANINSQVVYQGTGMVLDTSNEQVFPILKGDDAMYAINPESGKKLKSGSFKVAGPDITLVAGYQSRYNHRVVMAGSFKMCSDDFIAASLKTDGKYESSANYELCLNLIKWNFQQKSVIKIQNFSHSLVDESLVDSGRQQPQEYKLKDEIQVSCDIYEKVNGKWVPYSANDVQLEFIMLDPYVRVTLENKSGSKYSTKFNVPDHNGVYKFSIDYNRYGLTRLLYTEIAPVRVLNHDEFPTMLLSAYPYYASVLLVIFGFLLPYSTLSNPP